jgi:integrase
LSDLVRKNTGKRWYLNASELYPDMEPYIDWVTFLPPELGTKHQREYLIKSSKQFLSAWCSSTSSVAHNTVKNRFWQLKRLVGWMARYGIWRFSKLTFDDMSEFIVSQGKRKVIATRTLRVKAYLFDAMWDLRSEYAAALRVNPVGLLQETQSRLKIRADRRWKPLDENVALPIIDRALRWISEHGRYVCSLMERLWLTRNSSIGITSDSRKRLCSRLYATFAAEDGFAALQRDLPQCPKTTYKVLQAAVSRTEGACVTSLLFLIGFRSSELVRLDVDCLKVSTDACIPTYSIEGIGAKGVGRRTWAATETIAKTVEVLVQMFALKRRASYTRPLLMTRVGALPAPPGWQSRTRRWRAVHVNRVLQRFVRSAGRELKTKPIKIHSHLGRKTFARFVALRDKRSLESLSYHFGHATRLITDGSYVGYDIELEQLIAEESRLDLARGLTELLTARQVAGKVAPELEALRKKARNFRGKLALDRLVDRLIEDGVALAPCDWGYCVYTQALSACQGSRTKPNEANRSPEICAGCANFGVTKQHQQYWKARRDREAVFLQNADLSEQAKIIAEKRLRNSEQILDKLDAEISHPTMRAAK